MHTDMAQATCESLKEALDREKESLVNALKQCDLFNERCLVLKEENDMVRVCVCVCACVCACVCVDGGLRSVTVIFLGRNPPARLWQTNTNTRARTYTHTYTHAHTHSHIHARTHTYKHTNTRTQIRTHTQTHTQTHEYMCK